MAADLVRDAIVGEACAVAEPAIWEEVVETCRARFGPVEVLVNNVGISLERDDRKIEGRYIPLAEWRRVLDVNLTGAFLGIQALAPDMVDQGRGRIVNMSSQADWANTVVAGGHYGATKTGLESLTRTFANEFAAEGVTVNAVAPGQERDAHDAKCCREEQRGFPARDPGRSFRPRKLHAIDRIEHG